MHWKVESAVVLVLLATLSKSDMPISHLWVSLHRIWSQGRKLKLICFAFPFVQRPNWRNIQWRRKRFWRSSLKSTWPDGSVKLYKYPFYLYTDISVVNMWLLDNKGSYYCCDLSHHSFCLQKLESTDFDEKKEINKRKQMILEGKVCSPWATPPWSELKVLLWWGF